MFYQACTDEHFGYETKQHLLYIHSFLLIFMQNHIAERVWVEINSRCTYPMKSVLVRLKNCDMIAMEDENTKYCVSEFLITLSRCSAQNVIDAWNSRSITGVYHSFEDLMNQHFHP